MLVRQLVARVSRMVLRLVFESVGVVETLEMNSMLGFLKTTSAPIAIDFGYSAVKVLQVHAGNELRVVGAAIAEIPASIRQRPSERSNYLLETLPGLIHQGGFKGKVAVCSIPAWQTYIQHFQVEKTDSEGIREQVKSQLQMSIVCDPDCAVIRHVEVGDVFRDGGVMREVIAFAVSRDVVMSQVELLRKCKLEAGGLHAEPIAVLQAYHHLYRRSGDENTTTLYVDIGNHGTKAMIAHGRELKFAKSIPVGGRHFDEEIARALHCEIEAAHEHRMHEVYLCSAAHRSAGMSASSEKALGGSDGQAVAVKGAMLSVAATASSAATGHGKHFGGWVSRKPSKADRRQGSIPGEFYRVADDAISNDVKRGEDGESLVRKAMSEIVGQLVEELRMSVRYHRASFPNRPIDRMILNGGECGDLEMCRRVASSLGVRSYVGDPLKRLRVVSGSRLQGIDDLRHRPGWAVPIGLCFASSVD